MSKEAMKLALEALERVNNVDDDCDILSRDLANFVVDTIDAVKEALASEQEQRSDSEHTGELVATDWERIARVQNAKLMAMCGEAGGFEKLCEVMDKYKATTSQQRTWVGLSREDCYQVRENESNDFMYGVAWAEAKLKEKNT